MKVAFGFKAHSGWAALVVIGVLDGGYVVTDRRRVELVEEAWARQPYHAAEHLDRQAGIELVARGVAAAHRVAVTQMRAAIKLEQNRNNKVTACAVITGATMDNWSTEEILAVHFRMHKAEGVLFREALARAAIACALHLVQVPEKSLMKYSSLAVQSVAGPPWGKDQKDASLAAIIALQNT
jgi:hypothetical protein